MADIFLGKITKWNDPKFGLATFSADAPAIGEPKRVSDPLDTSAEFVPSHQALSLPPPPAMDGFSSRYSR